MGLLSHVEDRRSRARTSAASNDRALSSDRGRHLVVPASALTLEQTWSGV